MRRLRIDFAPMSGRARLARVHPAAWLVAAAAAAIGMHAAIALADVNRRQGDIDAELRRVQTLRARQTAHANAPAKSAILETQAHAVNAAIAQLNLPWRDVLDAVEAATPETIALLAIEPDAKKQIVKGTAEAKSSDAMIAYVEDLKRQPFFTFVTLTKHEINAQDPNKPIRFQFEAQWEAAP
jgi:Tfp pilus assembly protein PilN